MVCPRCAATVSATDLFCENCGYSLSGASAPSDTPNDAPGNASMAKTCLCPPGQSKPDEDGFCLVCGLRCIPEAQAARRHVEVSVDAQLAVVSDIGRSTLKRRRRYSPEGRVTLSSW